MSTTMYIVNPSKDGNSKVNLGGEVYSVGQEVTLPKAVALEALENGVISLKADEVDAVGAETEEEVSVTEEVVDYSTGSPDQTEDEVSPQGADDVNSIEIGIDDDQTDN